MIESYRLNIFEVGNLLQEAQRKYKCDISPYYLNRALDVVYSTLKKWKRVFVLRFDLRMADCNWGGDSDLPTAFQRADSQAITRFIESLKSRLREDHRRKGHRGEPCKPSYIWVRERDKGVYPHYHIVLFFNKDQYAFLGDYSNRDADNLATRVQRAWCSALDLHYPDAAKLVHIVENGAYRYDHKAAVLHSSTYWKLLIRIAYLCKERTKVMGDGFRSFGCSQAER